MPKITYEKVTRNKDSSFSVIDYYKPDVSMLSHSVYCQNVSFLTRNIGLLRSNRFTIYCTNL